MQPLAERMRPKNFDDYIGQEHLVGEGAVLREAIKSEQIPSFILWRPLGVGKTSLAKLISQQLDCQYHAVGAISAVVKHIREVIDKAKDGGLFSGSCRTILFVDEIHRLSNSQQDTLLKAVE